jgi:hypothetical protein
MRRPFVFNLLFGNDLETVFGENRLDRKFVQETVRRHVMKIKPLLLLNISTLGLMVVLFGHFGHVQGSETADISATLNDRSIGTNVSLSSTGSDGLAYRTTTAVESSFIYQGKLTDNGSPANGSYDFLFILHDAPSDGNQVGVTAMHDVAVVDGLFTLELDFGDVFEGAALWMIILVRPGDSTGAFTLLDPPQPLTAAPYAVSLRPGAVISGTVPGGTGVLNLGSTANGLQVTSSGYGVRVDSAGLDGVFINAAGDDGVSIGSAEDDGLFVASADDDGVFVCTTGNETSCAPNSTNNGVEIGNTADHGVRVDSAGSSGVYVDTAGGDGLYVNSAGYSGFYVNSAGDYGLFVDSAPVALGVRTTLGDGIYMDSTGLNGVHVNAAGKDGVYVCTTGSETECTENQPSNNGVEIGNAEGDGFYVYEAGKNGISVGHANETGVLIGWAEEDGIYIDSAWADGIHINSAFDWGGYFGGNIYVGGSCTGCRLASFGINISDAVLEPGDLVSIAGVQSRELAGAPMLLQIDSARSGGAIVGIVQGRAEMDIHDDSVPNETVRLVPRAGAAKPGEYVLIVTYGPMQVRADGPIAPGTRLTVGDHGMVRPLHTVEIDGVQLAESAPILGIALSEPDAEGQIWVLVNPH